MLQSAPMAGANGSPPGLQSAPRLQRAPGLQGGLPPGQQGARPQLMRPQQPRNPMAGLPGQGMNPYANGLNGR